MIKVFVDSINSAGYIEGWAYDTKFPLRSILVSIIADEDREIAWGLANLYRQDLVQAGCGTGWCAFSLKLDEWPITRPWQKLQVADRSSGARLITLNSLPYISVQEVVIGSIAEVISNDPTVIASLDHLRGCGKVFEDFVAFHGAAAFIRMAYIYLLDRPADADGLKAYENHMKKKGVAPFDLMLAIADSEEYRSRPRQHCAPTAKGFPFCQG